MRSNQETIRDQSCLNPIGVESSMQRDHDELKIMLQNCLISSGFNQELPEEENTSVFIKKYPARDVDHPFCDEMRAIR